MEGLGKLLQALSGFAWPSLILFGVWTFRVRIDSLFQLTRQQLASGAAIKMAEFRIQGS